MKTLLAATVLAMMSGPAIADWEDVFKNPDLDPKYGSGYGLEFPPVQASVDKGTSLDEFYRDNPDVYSGRDTMDSTLERSHSTSAATTSLDVFTQHNPDQYDGIGVGGDTSDKRHRTDTPGIGDSPRSF